MYCVYLIKSKKSNKYYIGYTKDLKTRLKDHNLKKEISTKSDIPWELIYYEAYKDQKSARRRENKLKQYGQGLRRLKERIGL